MLVSTRVMGGEVLTGKICKPLTQMLGIAVAGLGGVWIFTGVTINSGGRARITTGVGPGLNLTGSHLACTCCWNSRRLSCISFCRISSYCPSLSKNDPQLWPTETWLPLPLLGLVRRLCPLLGLLLGDSRAAM